jgi:hypothetical protein
MTVPRNQKVGPMIGLLLKRFHIPINIRRNLRTKGLRRNLITVFITEEAVLKGIIESHI